MTTRVSFDSNFAASLIDSWVDHISSSISPLSHSLAQQVFGNQESDQRSFSIDLNNLKRTNDTYGHSAGDRLIEMWAEAARAQWPDARGYRMGGDEFLFLIALPQGGTPIEQQLEAFQQRCNSMTQTLADGTAMHPHSALGFALRSDPLMGLEQCMAQADARMYAMKATQRKRSTDIA